MCKERIAVGRLLRGCKIGTPAVSGRNLLTTGILGGFTTFSAFPLNTALLYERGEWALASLYVVASVGLAVAGLFAGLFLIRTLS